jgi:hypothetical protein
MLWIYKKKTAHKNKTKTNIFMDGKPLNHQPLYRHRSFFLQMQSCVLPDLLSWLINDAASIGQMIG